MIFTLLVIPLFADTSVFISSWYPAMMITGLAGSFMLNMTLSSSSRPWPRCNPVNREYASSRKNTPRTAEVMASFVFCFVLPSNSPIKSPAPMAEIWCLGISLSLKRTSARKPRMPLVLLKLFLSNGRSSEIHP